MTGTRGREARSVAPRLDRRHPLVLARVALAACVAGTPAWSIAGLVRGLDDDDASRVDARGRALVALGARACLAFTP